VRITEVEINLTPRDSYEFRGSSFRPAGIREDESEACEVRISLRCSPAEAAAIYNMRGRPVDVRSAQEGSPQLPKHAKPEVVECRVDDAKALPPKSTIP
jgi:hypothetical protein